jgi:hypothetical protein
MKDIYKMLNWKNSSHIRDEGICLAKEIKDLSLLIMPPDEPSVWEACAKILFEKSDEELEPYLLSLLEWFQDLNWAGAITILNRLKAFSGEKLMSPFILSLKRAAELDNDEGLIWIDYLSELLDNDDLKARLPKEIIQKLDNHRIKRAEWYNS